MENAKITSKKHNMMGYFIYIFMLLCLITGFVLTIPNKQNNAIEQTETNQEQIEEN